MGATARRRRQRGRSRSQNQTSKQQKQNSNNNRIGTHPSAPSVLASDPSVTLASFLARHPEALGAAVRARFGLAAASLPFLFKVLSVQTALSIQSHPDKRLAERLHASNPAEYKDANHKPEMALALEDFEALCGFVSARELAAALDATPELNALVGDGAAAAVKTAAESDDAEAFRAPLKAAFSAVMSASAASAAAAVDALVARLEQEKKAKGGGGSDANANAENGENGGAPQGPVRNSVSAKNALALRLASQYPSDVGVLACYFLNYLSLPRGSAVHLPANVPHAYLSGQLVECMAESDNVVRAGLTPKFRDVETLCSSLTYDTGSPQVLTGERAHDHARVYRPPFDEFEIGKVDVPGGESGVRPLAANRGPVLLLVTAGNGSVRAEGGALPAASDEALKGEVELRRGSVVFVPAGARLAFSAGAGGGEGGEGGGGGGGLEIWTAAVNARVFAAPAAEEEAAVPAAAEKELAAAV
jgi:mannose-6-phosphate isomerase